MVLNDETLMAYADGELASLEAAQIAAILATDPVLAARVAVFEQSRKAVAQAFALKSNPTLHDPIAERIRQLSSASTSAPSTGTPPLTDVAPPSNVIALPQRRHVPFWQLPLAASIALVAGLGAGQFLSRAPVTGGEESAILGDPGLLPALATIPSGSGDTLASGAQVTLIATFENGDGDLCREFEYDLPSGMTTVAVACQTANDWRILLAIAADAGADGYAPASSLDALDAWLSGTDAKAPLSPQQEAAALAATSGP